MPEKTRPPNAAKGRKSSRPAALSYGYNSPFADDEHIVRHSLSSQEGMPVLDAVEIEKQAKALNEARTKAGVNTKFQHGFELSEEELERDARLESDVEANEEAEQG
jgi:hypothetical protein